MTKVTTDLILQTMKELVEEKHLIAPAQWLDASFKLNLLVGDEEDRLYEIESRLAKMKAAYIEEGETSAAAKARVEAEDDFLEMRKLKGKVKRVQEFIRIAKTRAKLKEDEFMRQ